MKAISDKDYLKNTIFFIGIAFSVFFFFESRYALSKTLEFVQLRVDQHIIADSLDINQHRLWELRKQCKQNLCTEKEETEMMELEDKVDKQKKKLDMIEQRMDK